MNTTVDKYFEFPQALNCRFFLKRAKLPRDKNLKLVLQKISFLTFLGGFLSLTGLCNDRTKEVIDERKLFILNF